MSLHDALQWRYAAKRMNGQKVTEAKLTSILKAAQLAPTSMGLQPFTIFVVESPALREQIRAVAFNQPQVTEASHLLVFAAWTTLTETHIDEYLEDIMQTREVSAESLAAFRRSMIKFAGNTTPEAQKEWAARQSYISFSFALAEAALLQVDTTPMEGFNIEQLDALLGLEALGLTSVTLLPIGYRDEENDILVNVKKVRRAADKLFVHL